jgi:sporadic carbohydrate cluster 2OG-Fe(II) oxygenase
MYFTDNENKITAEYLEQGYIIKPVANIKALNWIKREFVRIVSENIGKKFSEKNILNMIHQEVPVNQLNTFRLKIIRDINSHKDFRHMYYKVAKPYLDTLVGNELAMQLRVNLSIQYPEDDSSLLATHADTWSGDSPFEIVVWLPLVDCYGTKAMYILPPNDNKELENNFIKQTGNSSEDLFNSIKEKVKWLALYYGEVLLFDQGLPHGNRINNESETRWSLNCRFKGVFTPYGDKKIGEFFEPITIRAASQKGLAYQMPKT